MYTDWLLKMKENEAQTHWKSVWWNCLLNTK